MNMNSFYYFTELICYFTSFLYKAMVNRFVFSIVLTNSSDTYAYEHTFSPNDGSKNQLYYFLPR